MAEHVSIFSAKAKPRKRAAVMKHFDRWDREQRRHAKGFLRAELSVGRDDPNEIRGIVHWDNARNYYANARRPEQDQWHKELVQMLERPPRWWDGSLAATHRGPARTNAAKPGARRAAAKPASRRRATTATRRRPAAPARRPARRIQATARATARRRPASASSRR
jgi:quinol monooxygenase YgiN